MEFINIFEKSSSGGGGAAAAAEDGQPRNGRVSAGAGG